MIIIMFSLSVRKKKTIIFYFQKYIKRKKQYRVVFTDSSTNFEKQSKFKTI